VGGRPADAETEARTRPIALHAWRIAFRDPDVGATVEVECPPPGHLA
jgi:23S rRNA-/tRNA-specific pseudouridylate synthase